MVGLELHNDRGFRASEKNVNRRSTARSIQSVCTSK